MDLEKDKKMENTLLNNMDVKHMNILNTNFWVQFKYLTNLNWVHFKYLKNLKWANLKWANLTFFTTINRKLIIILLKVTFGLIFEVFELSEL